MNESNSYDIIDILVRFLSMSNDKCETIYSLITKKYKNQITPEEIEVELNKIEQNLRENKEIYRIEVKNIRYKDDKPLESSIFFKDSGIPHFNPRLRKIKVEGQDQKFFSVNLNSKQEGERAIEYLNENYVNEFVGFTEKSNLLMADEEKQKNKNSQLLREILTSSLIQHKEQKREYNFDQNIKEIEKQKLDTVCEQIDISQEPAKKTKTNSHESSNLNKDIEHEPVVEITQHENQLQQNTETQQPETQNLQEYVKDCDQSSNQETAMDLEEVENQGKNLQTEETILEHNLNIQSDSQLQSASIISQENDFNKQNKDNIVSEEINAEIKQTDFEKKQTDSVNKSDLLVEDQGKEEFQSKQFSQEENDCDKKLINQEEENNNAMQLEETINTQVNKELVKEQQIEQEEQIDQYSAQQIDDMYKVQPEKTLDIQQANEQQNQVEYVDLVTQKNIEVLELKEDKTVKGEIQKAQKTQSPDKTQKKQTKETVQKQNQKAGTKKEKQKKEIPVKDENVKQQQQQQQQQQNQAYSNKGRPTQKAEQKVKEVEKQQEKQNDQKQKKSTQVKLPEKTKAIQKKETKPVVQKAKQQKQKKV